MSARAYTGVGRDASVSGRLVLPATVQWLLAVLFGVALPLSLAPIDWWPLALVAVAGLFWLLGHGTPRRALAIGYGYGLGKYGVGVSWVFVSIHEYGDAPVPLAAAMVALFVAGLALFPALMAWLYARWVRTPDAWLRNAFGFAAVLVLLEWLLTWFMTGFPWLFLGYAFLDTPLQQWAPVGGVLLVSFLGALCAASLVAAACLSRPLRWSGLVVGALPWLGAALLAGITWVQPAGTGTAALVQGNVPQELKWRPETVQPILDRYRDLSAPHWNNDLVIWPEAALTLFQHEATDYLMDMSARASQNDAGLVLGIPAYERRPDGSAVFLNTAIAIGDGGGAYTKRRLVPFGEYVPLERYLRGLIGFFDLPMARAARGPADQPPLIAAGRRVAMAICYEIVYPDAVRRSVLDADLIVTISNDAWFGSSIGPHQHMQMARMRALENGRWLLRGTNNGITAIVDHRGRFAAQLPQFETGVLVGGYQVMEGHTPYARTGSVPLVVALMILAGILAGLRRRKKGNSAGEESAP